MDKIDKAAIDLLEKLPAEVTARLSSFGVTIQATWSALSEEDKMLWLNDNRSQIAKLIGEFADQLKVVSKALTGDAGAVELVQLWRYVRKIT